MVIDAELTVAAVFLAPVLQRESIIKAKGKSIVEILDPGKEGSNDRGSNARNRVICKALLLLSNIHHVLCLPSSASSSDEVLRDLKNRRIIDGILDLVSLEGIYPSLSPGVGIPIERRVRSVLQGGIVTRTSSAEAGQEVKDKGLLIEITESLNQIAASRTTGLGPALQERTLVDLVAGLGELAYNPSYGESCSSHVTTLKTLLDAVPASTLLPILTSLIRPSTPLWFRVHLSTFLSLLPLRPNGMQQTISFIASTAPQAQYVPEEQSFDFNGHSSGLTLSVQVLEQASRLLVAVPSSMTTEVYFSSLGPQLLQLLDGTDIEMKRAAAYIIGNGILGKRKHGSPGTIGWEVFAQPILKAINPESAEEVSKKSKITVNSGLSETIIPENSLKEALNRLSALVLLHPNPGVTKRLITPSLHALWGLWCFSKETRRLSWTDQIYELFCVYFKTAAGVDQFISLIDQLRWNGGKSWTYGPGPKGGIELREHLEASDEKINVIATVQNIDSRIDELTRLLGARVLDDYSIITVFLHASKQWLLGNQTRPGRNSLECGDENTGDPLVLVVYAKITQKILENYKDTLAANPRKIIEFVNHLLAAFVTEHRDTELKASKASKPSFAGLSSIYNPETERSVEIDGHPVTTEEAPVEIVSIALSLMSAILFSSDISRAANIGDLVDFRGNLSYLATSRVLPTSLVLAALNIVALLDTQERDPSSLHDKLSAPLGQYDSDRKSHSLALTYLVDSLPPVRAQGLSLLTELVKKSSPVLDISSTTILLTSLLHDEDEFIYLSAIQALSLLASRHQRTVIKRLVEDYVDVPENKDLDVRIRVGEALLKTVESLGENLVGQPAKLVSEGMIAVAGRRGQRVKQKGARSIKAEQEQQARKEVEEAWGGDVPKLEDEIDDETSQRLAKVVEGWEGSQGEEDVRIRTSALSILGVAIETNVAEVGSTIVSTAVDLVLAILKLETTDEKTILRRAAVVVIMNLVKALDAADEGGRNLSFGFAGENLLEVISVLRYIAATDSDDLVLGHVGVVIGSLEMWQSKTILGVPRSAMDLTPRTHLNGGKLAGLSVDPEASIAPRPSIEEIE